MRNSPVMRFTSTATSTNAPARVIAGPLTSSLIRKRNISLVVVGIPSLSRNASRKLWLKPIAAGANVAFVPQLSCSSETSTDYVDIDGVLIASLGPARTQALV